MTTACVPMRIFHLGDNRVNCVRRDDIFNLYFYRSNKQEAKVEALFCLDLCYIF